MLARRSSAPRKQNSNRAGFNLRAPGFLQWIRGRRCILDGKAGHVCDGKIIAAHVDYAGGKGMGLKVADRFCVPMCGGPNGAHAEQHRVGWASFEARHRINALRTSNELWHDWHGRAEWEKARG